ncbi:MAG TPA: hypothetical protein VJL57_03895 [Candidatus Paceibacterota bacterium]
MKAMETKKVRMVLPKRPLSASLLRAAGLLKGKLKKTGLQYQRSMRKEWS